MQLAKTVVIVALLVGLTCSIAHSAEHFLSPDGDDDAAGTREAPWQTLQKASETAEAGDTVILLPGSYPGQLRPVNSGTAEEPIVFRSEPRMGARLIGADGEMSIVLEDVEHVRVEGLHVRPEASRSGWMIIRNSSNIVVDDCHMADSTGGMTHMENCEDIRVLNSVFHRHTGGINMFRVSGVTRLVFEGNVISRAGHCPLQLFPPNTNQYLVIRGNVFHSAWGRNFESFHDRDVLFENNIITHAFNSGWSASSHAKLNYTRGIVRFNRVFRNVGGPVSMSPWARDDGYLDTKRLYNNVFDDNAHHGISVASSHENTRDLLLVNNIFSRNDRHGVHRQLSLRGGTPEQLRLASNAFSAVDPELTEVRDYDDNLPLETLQSAEIREEHGTRYEDNLTVAPGYVDPDQYNHALRDDSPLRSAGRFLTAAREDGAGNLLPVEDAAYFYDGFGIEGEQGDIIAVGSAEQRAQVLAVDHEANTLLVDRELAWEAGDPVSLPWSGDAPDIGAYEHGDDGRAAVQVEVEPFRARPGEQITMRAVVHGAAEPAQVRWWLGDTNYAEGAEITHTYEEEYDYAIRVQVVDGEGRSHRGTGYAWVQEPVDPAEPLIHSWWGPDDDRAWWLWKSYRPGPTAYRDVVEGGVRHGPNTRNIPEGYEPPGDGVNYRHVMAHEAEARLTAQIHPDGWDIDRYPRIFMRYRVGEGTPVAITLRPFSGSAPTITIAASPAASVSEERWLTGEVLHDDGQWHELEVDARVIRELAPDLQVLEGMRIGASPRGDVVEGHWYDLDEVIIGPAVDE